MGLNLFKKNTNQNETQVVQRPAKNISVGKIVKYDDQESRFYDIIDIDKLTDSDIDRFKEDDMFSIAGHAYITYSQFKNMLIQKGKIAPQSIPKGQAIYLGDTNNTYDIVIKAYTETLNRFAEEFAQQFGIQGEVMMAKHFINTTNRAVFNHDNKPDSERYLGFTNNNNAREDLIRKTTPPVDIPEAIQQFLKEHGEDIKTDGNLTQEQIASFATLFTTLNYNKAIDIDIEKEKLH